MISEVQVSLFVYIIIIFKIKEALASFCVRGKQNIKEDHCSLDNLQYCSKHLKKITNVIKT